MPSNVRRLKWVCMLAGVQVRPVFPLAVSQWAHYGSGFAAATLRPDELQVRAASGTAVL